MGSLCWAALCSGVLILSQVTSGHLCSQLNLLTSVQSQEPIGPSRPCQDPSELLRDDVQFSVGLPVFFRTLKMMVMGWLQQQKQNDTGHQGTAWRQNPMSIHTGVMLWWPDTGPQRQLVAIRNPLLICFCPHTLNIIFQSHFQCIYRSIRSV